jgi:hypothetical protein
VRDICSFAAKGIKHTTVRCTLARKIATQEEESFNASI